MSTTQPNARSLPPAGTFGPLVAVARLGSGGFGTVFRVKHAQTGAEYALKVLKLDHVDEDLLARFAREMQVLAAFRDPGIVRIHGAGRTAEGAPWFSMDLLEGAPLSELIARAGQLPPREAAALVAKVARTMARAHAKGIVHRDLKPENIFVDAGSGDPRLVDFGLAWDDAGAKDRLTRTGVFVGTPAYMAPEQCEGKPATAADDIWALGVVLFKATTGELPYLASGSYGMMQAILTREPRLPSQASRGLPAAVDEVFLRCCERDPKRRYQDGVELAEDLEALARGEPVSAKGRVAARARAVRRRRLTSVGALLLAASVVGAAGAYWLRGRAEIARRVEAERRAARAALDAFDPSRHDLAEVIAAAPALAAVESGTGDAADAERIGRLRPLAAILLRPPGEASRFFDALHAEDPGALRIGAELALAAAEPLVASERLRAVDRKRADPGLYEATRARVRAALLDDDAAPEVRLREAQALREDGVRPTDLRAAFRTDLLALRAGLVDQALLALGRSLQGAGLESGVAGSLVERTRQVEALLRAMEVPSEASEPTRLLDAWAIDPANLDAAVKKDAVLHNVLLARATVEAGSPAAVVAIEDRITSEMALHADKEANDVYLHAWKEAFVALFEEGRAKVALDRTNEVPEGSKQPDVMLARGWAWLFVAADPADGIAQLDELIRASRDPEGADLAAFLGEAHFVRGMLRLAKLSPPEPREGLADLVRSLRDPVTPTRLRVRAALVVTALEPRLRTWAERALAGDRSPPPSPPGR